MRKLTVGQVLFVLVPGEMTIHPVRVVEEVNRRTLQGEEVNYHIEIAGKGGQKTVPLDDDVLTFSNIEEARTHLYSNAQSAINKICDKAQAIAQREFPQDQLVAKNVKNVERPPVTEAQSVLLDNGMKVTVRLPPELSE